GHHHDPRTLPDGQRTLTTVIAIADRIAAEVAEGFRLDITNTAIDPAWLDELKFTQQKVEEIKQSLPEKIKEVEVLLTGS
ncbi:MAG: hypothetical protein JNK58_01520, partial [Phycisphaerae bacterium]|nr:hypothetical protein [Phycisphaerae bacterium]